MASILQASIGCVYDVPASIFPYTHVTIADTVTTQSEQYLTGSGCGSRSYLSCTCIECDCSNTTTYTRQYDCGLYRNVSGSYPYFQLSCFSLCGIGNNNFGGIAVSCNPEGGLPGTYTACPCPAIGESIYAGEQESCFSFTVCPGVFLELDPAVYANTYFITIPGASYAGGTLTLDQLMENLGPGAILVPYDFGTVIPASYSSSTITSGGVRCYNNCSDANLMINASTTNCQKSTARTITFS